MVVIGGYVGKDISCDSPGIYVFNTSSLQWTNSFTSLSPGSSGSGSGSGSGEDQASSIVQGSVGYEVPAPVQSIIGGSSLGGATASTPAVGSATAGPIATGKPPTFTVTQSGSIVTQTAQPTPAPNTSPVKSGTNVGAITAGVIAAVLAILAGYLAFCTWLYRRQLKMYKNHVAMAQRTAFNNSPDPASRGGSVTGSGGRMNEKPGAGGVMLGPFGTEIGGGSGNAGSAGRASMGESSGSGPGQGLTPSSNFTPGSGPDEGSGAYGGGIYGGGVYPSGRAYGPLSEADENENTEYMGGLGRPSGSTAHSSTEDLLSGQEPSFFSVVLNPRRTLRVVNSD
jgi:hypothetical protein